VGRVQIFIGRLRAREKEKERKGGREYRVDSTHRLGRISWEGREKGEGGRGSVSTFSTFRSFFRRVIRGKEGGTVAGYSFGPSLWQKRRERRQKPRRWEKLSLQLHSRGAGKQEEGERKRGEKKKEEGREADLGTSSILVRISSRLSRKGEGGGGKGRKRRPRPARVSEEDLRVVSRSTFRGAELGERGGRRKEKGEKGKRS